MTFKTERMTAPRHPPVSHRPTLRGLLSVMLPASLLILDGCHHRDAVDTTLDWYHQYQGGMIAQQRPPAPGLNGPYPKVGLTPTAAPELPSMALRQTITGNLITARNLSQRTEAQNGTLTPIIPPPPGQVAAGKTSGMKPGTAGGQSVSGTVPANPATGGNSSQPKIPEGAMGAVLDAADSPPSPTPASVPPAAASPSKPQNATAATNADDAEIAMPVFVSNKATAVTGSSQVLPEIPAGPPPAPSFPGFSVPADAGLPDRVHPDYDLSQQEGVIIHFLPGSDQLSPGQESTLSKLSGSRGTSTLYLHCSGETVSMSASDQSQAVELGLLRARTLSDALRKNGVPASSMRIISSAFGAGARVSKNG
ncbi:OmpA family protein [Acetobacter fallax]|nr:hypothetical protein [Acetobacter fallax]